MDKLWKEFVDGHKELSLLHDDEPGVEYFDGNWYDESEERCSQLRAHIFDHLEEIDEDDTNSTASTKATTIAQQHFKLPSLHVPEFEGRYESWRSFHDLYVAAVHNNPTIPPVHKLQYLRSRLKGEAAAQLESYTITETNYDPAWKALLARYNNKRALVNTQLRTLLEQPAASETASGIRNLVDTTNKCLNALTSLEIDVKGLDSIIVFLVSQRLPMGTRTLWEQGLFTDEIPTLKQLSEFLERRFRTLEHIGSAPSTTTAPSKHSVKKSTQSFYADTTREQRKKECTICGIFPSGQDVP